MSADKPDLKIHIDGAARGNPGPAAYGIVLARDGQPTLEEGGCLGSTTNNVAEYTALVRALQHARNLGARRLLIHSDSELMVKQMNGAYKVKNEQLKKLYEQAQDMLDDFEDVVIRHVRREYNSDADRLCNEALDGYPRALELNTSGAAPAKVAATKAAPVKETRTLEDDVVGCLRKAGVDDPTALWAELSGILKSHRVRLPGSER
ncbi:MAG: ribonuclease HI family protein [Gemmataceae bacterium]